MPLYKLERNSFSVSTFGSILVEAHLTVLMTFFRFLAQVFFFTPSTSLQDGRGAG